ncbi:hypothetical protein G2W53_029940 [Senna tora]|uniref:Uncharacterized protein n=1 Tax=Senna tora TaxID=362788 RepID=A0A834T8E3_9FABA|nr:hypothetical protein G2W53_029940 [Senna tora]
MSPRRNESKHIAAGGLIRNHLGGWLGGFSKSLGAGNILAARGCSSISVPVIFAVVTFVLSVTSSPSFCTVKSYFLAPSVASVFKRPLLDFNIASDWYTGTPWYSSNAVFPAAVKFLYFGKNALNTSSMGQNTVNPPSILSIYVASASDARSVSAKTLQPCLDIMAVRFCWLERVPSLFSAPNPTLPPLRSVMLTNPEVPGAVPVAWNIVAAKAVVVKGGVLRVLGQNARNVVRGNCGAGDEQQHREEQSLAGGHRPELHSGSARWREKKVKVKWNQEEGSRKKREKVTGQSV